MLGFLKSSVGKFATLFVAALMLVVGFTHSAEAGCRCKRNHKHPVLKFIGRALLVLFCFGLVFATAAPALAGGGLFGGRVVQRTVVRQQVVRQKVVVQQQLVAQPVVVQQLYAQPLVQQQLVVPQQFYVPSQQIIQQRVVAPGCQAFFAR